MTTDQDDRIRRTDAQYDQDGAGDSAPPPTHMDVLYGPHRKNLLDFWRAESDGPTPVLVSIHGGGFRSGQRLVSKNLLTRCLASGISVAAITYRLSGEAIAPAQFEDAARAVQFIRAEAEEWNIDPDKLAAMGWSAGAGLSLWLGFHEDLADPESDDPVLRQSTRLKCMIAMNGQTSYDPRVIRELIPECDTGRHFALAELFDVDMNKLDELPEEKYRLFEEVSSINHLTKGDPPAMLIYRKPLEAAVTDHSIGIHHPRFGRMLKEKMDKLGICCELEAGEESQPGRPERIFAFLQSGFGRQV